MLQKKKFLVMRVPRIAETEMFDTERAADEAVRKILEANPSEALYIVPVHFNTDGEDDDKTVGRGRPN